MNTRHFVNTFCRQLTLIFWVSLFSNNLYAQDKVVVIPMSGDDIKPLANIVTVAKENGDFDDVALALASITDASDSNRYLIVVAPGIYSISETLVMKEFVSISGSGQQITKLTGSVSAAGSGQIATESALISSAYFSSISNLTIENIGDSLFTTGIRDTLTAATGAPSSGGIALAPFTINDVNIFVSSSPPMNAINFATGIRVHHANVNNVRVEMQGALGAFSVAFWIDGEGSINNGEAILNGGVSTTGISASGEDFAINNVRVKASGGTTQNIGVSDDTFGGESGSFANLLLNITGNNGVGVSVGGTGGGAPTTTRIQTSTIIADTALSGASDVTIHASQSSLRANTISGGLAKTTCVASDNGFGVVLFSTSIDNCSDPTPL